MILRPMPIERTSLAPVAPLAYSPFNQAGNKHSSGMWTKSYPTPYDKYVRTAAAGIAGFLESVQSLRSSARDMLAKGTSALQAREAKASDPSALNVRAQDGASAKSYRVRIDSLAQAQKNAGKDLRADEAAGIGERTNRFKLTYGGKETTISARFGATDTNDGALVKLRDAINQAKTGVTASVVKDPENGAARLELKGNDTGADRGFSIEDESGQAVAWSGIGAKAEAASDASYTVDGVRSTSSSNAIELEKGKTSATLLKASPNEVEVRVGADERKALDQVSRLLGAYNGAIGQLRENGGYLNPQVKRSLENAANADAFSGIGIRRNADGTLALDERAFKASLNGNLERTAKALEGRYGLAGRLGKEADRLQDVPASALMNKSMLALQQFAAYQSTMQSYLQIPTTGLLVNQFL